MAIPVATLRITGKGFQKAMKLGPQGVLIGRGRPCDVELPDDRVSRHHAQIYRDPFGRWVVRDLGSHNGVFVGKKKVDQEAVLPGEPIRIGPYDLTVLDPSRRGVAGDPTVTLSTTVVEGDSDTGQVEQKEPSGQSLSQDRIRDLNEMGQRLAGIAESSAVYPELCRCLARIPGSIAMVLRVPDSSEPLPPSPGVLACSPDATPSGDGVGPKVHISRRVLEAARFGEAPVRACSVPGLGTRMTLTCVSGEENARSVFCARVEGTGGDLDLAYLDIPSSAEFPGMLDFVQAASRQAGWAAQAMLKAEAKAEMQVIDDQLSMAREIQLRLIPQGLEHIKGVEVALCYEPAMWVGGDYCDVWQTEDERLVFAVGDVCGKGLPAAIIMANLHAAIRATMSSCPQPADAVRYLNSHLDRHVTYGQFITLVLGVFNPKTDEIRYVNAGHILPLVITPERQVETLGEPRNQPLGLASREIREDRGILKPGASLVIVTDGIVETQSTDGAMFGPEGVCRAIRTATNLSGRSLAEHLVQTAAEFRGLGPQRDDITALVMVHRGP